MEAKVSFHVRRFLRECEERGVRPSEETVTAHLRDTYGEYQRKPAGALKRVVVKVLKKAQGAPSADAAGKRARSESSDEDERMALEFEKQAALAPSNALNNSLRQNYESSAKAAAAAATVTTAGAASEDVGEKPAKKAKVRQRSDAKAPRESRSRSAADGAGDGDGESSGSGFVVSRPTTRYADFGGIQAILQEVKELIEYPLTHPEVYAHLGIVSGMSGESEQKLRELFDEAVARAPSIVFIDEIDAITPKRETSARGMEKRIVAQLLTSTDALSLANTGGKPVLIIGATNRPDALDSALRRAGRFDREICLGIPDEAARERILHVLAGKMRLDGSFDFRAIAKKTPGYVGADLVSLTKEAAVIAVNRIFSTMLAGPPEPATTAVESVAGESEATTTETAVTAAAVDVGNQEDAAAAAADSIRSRTTPFTAAQLAPLSITMADFVAAVAKVQPSAKREGFATIPDVTWVDIGALASVREELVLIKGPELLDKYVGESERAVRQVFQRARASSPCVVFFDELDALAPRRAGGAGSEGGNGVSERVVNQLLTEMDGLDARRNVFVIAATNRPDIIDPAMLRPGRLDKLLYVALPVAAERLAILMTLTTKSRLDPGVALAAIAHDARCEGFSGADLSALVREAGIAALRETDLVSATATTATATQQLSICARHFDQAFETVFPSVSRADQRLFDKMKKNLRRARSSMAATTTTTTTTTNADADADAAGVDAVDPSTGDDAEGGIGNAMEVA
ncbi:hypothetical protein PybrP1_009758 [[Pythium] brassicae (nom. inval.)]|nr:hypothetical protein PybrP1_009758 [[Pythium] brassicae (nom. inval.)]